MILVCFPFLLFDPLNLSLILILSGQRAVQPRALFHRALTLHGTDRQEPEMPVG